MRRLWRDFLLGGLLLLFPLLLFAPVSLGPKTLIPADALYLFQPYRAAADSLGVDAVQNPLLADLVLENYAWKQFLVEAITSGSLPLWDPYLFSGHPFLANGQHSALYPLTWLFFLIPIPRAFGVFIVVQLGLAGISMYILGRVIRAGSLGSLIAGLTFQLSGFMVASVVHPMIIAGASWLPLLLALVECTVARRRFWAQKRAMLPWALLGAITLGLQTLSGHPEITYFVLLVVAGFAAWRLVYQLLTRPRSEWRSEVLSPALGILLMTALGLGLGAVQLVPFYEVARDSFREGAVTLEQVLGWAYPKRRLITFLIPNFFGNPTHRTLVDVFTGQTVEALQNAHGQPIGSFDWGIKNYVEGGAYLGILPLLLALIALLSPPDRTALSGDGQRPGLSRVGVKLRSWLRQPYVPFFAALSAFSLACVFGTPVYALVYALPFISQSHSPFRWVFPLTVAAAALAGLGAARVGRYLEKGARSQIGTAEERRRPWWLRVVLFDAPSSLVSVVGAAAIWGGLAVAGGVGASWLAFDRIEPLLTRAFWSLAKASHAFPDSTAFYSYLVPWTLIFAGFLLAGGIVLRVSRCSIPLPFSSGRVWVWQALALVVVLADLVVFGAGFNPAVDPSLLAYQPPVIDFLKTDGGLWRFSTFDPQGRNTLNMNTGMFYGLQDVRGYDSLFSSQYARYMGWIEPQDLLPYNRIAPFREFSSLDSPLTDLLNVKYVITEEEIPLPKYREVYRDDAVRVYENLGVGPRAFTLPAGATVVADGVDQVHEALLTYDPRYYVIVEREAAGWSGPARPALEDFTTEAASGTPAAQDFISYTANEVIIEVITDEPSWLVLADSYAPGWKAFKRPVGGTQDDEVEIPIARVAGNFRGVMVDGSSEVRFKYTPNSVKLGAFTSFLSGMMVVFLGVVWTWRLVYRESEDQTTVQRLAKNSVAPIALNIFNRVVDFAFAALMLRILGPANAGDYYYAINVFLWFDILTNFGLNTYLTREVARHRQQARRYLMNTTLLRLGLSLAGVPLLLAFIGVRQTAVAYLTSPASRQAILAIMFLYLGSMPYSISTGLTALFYAYEKAEYPAALTSVSTLLKVTLQTLILVAGWGIVGLAGASILVNVATLLILGALAWRLFPSLRRAGVGRTDAAGHPSEPSLARRPRSGRLLLTPEDRTLRREMVRDSWPLMVNHLLAYLFFKVDVFLMEPILGSESLGLYSIGYKYLDAVMVVPSMFTLALFPVISRQAQNNREALVRFYRLGVKILVLLAFLAALVATVAGREMVLVLGGAEYLPGAMHALRLMAWSIPIGWINSITQYVLIAVDEQRYLTRAYAWAFGFSLLANLVLMPRFGYPASAVLHIVSELVLLIPFLLRVRRQFGAVGWGDVVLKPLLTAVVTGACGVLLLKVGSGVALVAVLVAYPLLAWALGVLTPEERALLAPLLQRRSRAVSEPSEA